MFNYKKLRESNVDFSVINYLYHPNEGDRENSLTLVLLHGYPSGCNYAIVAKGYIKCSFQDFSGNEIVNIDFDAKTSTLELTDPDEEFYIKLKATSFELYDLGKIEVKNPYQLLIDLELIKL